jgi:hypothetical protein
MDIREAQLDLRHSFAGGGPGVLVSGLVWLAAALTGQTLGTPKDLLVLFVGGMLIYPLSVFIVRTVLKRPRTRDGNPLVKLSIEATMPLFAGLLIGYASYLAQPELAVPFFAIIIGARYAVFSTLYGDPTYWLLGLLLATFGVVAAAAPGVLPIGTLFLVALTELVFGIILLARNWRTERAFSKTL